jgi:hypothetical protein
MPAIWRRDRIWENAKTVSNARIIDARSAMLAIPVAPRTVKTSAAAART